MDELLDYIRLGDNVVFQVSALEEYFFFARAFARQAIADGRNLIYIRFAQHEPVLTEEWEGVKICEFQPELGFEAFTVAIHERITEEGKDAFYVFDCLSGLQSAWYTDLMMGNFFRVTCPYLFQLDTVAFFPLIRGRHSFDATARIRETTQLFLDVYGDGGQLYLHPLKVWNRYLPDMFMPHVWVEGTEGKGRFEVVKDGLGIGRYYALRQEKEATLQDLNTDSYDRFFALARLQYVAGSFPEETQAQIIESTMTKDERMQQLIRKYFGPADYFALRDRMIGSGAIGGKACGMLLARKIAEKELSEEKHRCEPHDSFYIGSDVFYTYIVANDLWGLRIAQRTKEGYFSRAEKLREGLLFGAFPSNIREQFVSMLEYFGQTPIIVRSSSFLEDGFGNAFAGKYESVFCANRGTPEERLAAFENAVRQVYASTMDPSALEYRRQRGLEKKDEQMAILVQRVSGSYYGKLYMPCAAGVGYSYSTYQWRRDIDPDAVLPVLPRWLKNLLLEHDYEAEQRLYDMGRPRQIWFISCQRLLENEAFTGLMKKLLATLQRVYENPVDIEYTVNCGENGDFLVNLLQCRPLYVGQNREAVRIPALKAERTFFDIYDTCMGRSSCRKLDALVLVDPKEYYEYPYARKSEVAGVIGRINRYFLSQPEKKNVLLAVPGRIGTSSPELGIPAAFAELSGYCGICEVSDDRAGYMPELSFGSHMFQDLVEADIFYAAIYADREEICYHRDCFADCPDLFAKICPQEEGLSSMISVYDLAGMEVCLWMDASGSHAACGVKDREG